MVIVSTHDAGEAERIMAVLGKVPDPEIPAVSVVDLGIVRGVSGDPPVVTITPTYSGCPATHIIGQMIRAALDAAALSHVRIDTVIAPPWSTDWITGEGHAKLHAYGIAPPNHAATATCPRCGSIATREISRFGSTPCKAQWQCRDCLEPFDRFKCH